MFTKEAGRLGRALHNTGTLFPEVESEVTEAAKVLEAFTCCTAGDPPSPVGEVRAEISFCGVIDALDHGLIHVELEASPGAEEFHLTEKDMHLLGGVGDEEKVVGVPQNKFATSTIVGEADPLGGLQEADKGAYH